MKESVMYQEFIAEGKELGKQEEAVNLILRQLNQKIGEISTELQTQITRLPVEQLENLGVALLNFQSQSNLVNWLEQN